jgi:hypothetical protein
MTPRCALLLFAIAQTARARSATLAAIASNADYANRLLLLWVAAAGILK